MSEDLIKRSDVIDMINEAFDIGDCFCDRYGLIGAIQSILATGEPQGWIPCSERLPKTGVANMCLVTVEFPRAHSRGVYCGSRVVNNDWECIDIEGTWTTLSGISKVLVWMP